MKQAEQSTKVVKALRNGQITIPRAFRQQLGIKEDSLLQVSLVDGELRVRPVRVAPAGQGSPWLKELYDLFAPVRQEAKRYREAEINETIDEAVNAVRKQHA
ncbi:MAG: AbrB/MazE/SpoVT family DNA-binding domain-containing protein [Chloroflexota bacterium]